MHKQVNLAIFKVNNITMLTEEGPDQVYTADSLLEIHNISKRNIKTG